MVESQLVNMQARELGPFVQLEFSLGNQSMTGIFDTGSSDLIVPEAGSNICRELQQCNRGTGTGFVAGSFDINAANVEATAGQSNTVFPFVNGAAFEGKLVNTTVNINPYPRPGAAAGSGSNGNNGGNVVVGVFNDGRLLPGTPLFPIFGVGPILGEAAVQSRSGPQYENLPQNMKNNGVIKSNAFGVYTNDFRKSLFSSASTIGSNGRPQAAATALSSLVA